MGAVGEPRRLARQLFGITEGFFAPLFFVWLGASLRVRELGERPGFILLGLGLGVVGMIRDPWLTLCVLSGMYLLSIPLVALSAWRRGPDKGPEQGPERGQVASWIP